MGLPQIIYLVALALIWSAKIYQLAGKLPHPSQSKNELILSIFLYPTFWIGITYWGGFFDEVPY